eukprot:2569161-Amphidinium_carterae.1
MDQMDATSNTGGPSLVRMQRWMRGVTVGDSHEPEWKTQNCGWSLDPDNCKWQNPQIPKCTFFTKQVQN